MKEDRGPWSTRSVDSFVCSMDPSQQPFTDPIKIQESGTILTPDAGRAPLLEPEARPPSVHPMATSAHRIFAVASIRPSGFPVGETKYRCVAALRTERCSGIVAVKAMLRCLILAGQRENAEVIRAELRTIDGKYGRWGGDPKIPDVPCPYVAFVLGAAYTTDLSTPGDFYYSHASFLSADIGSTEAGPDDDGISVIDLTDPFHPTYCFVSVQGLPTSLQPPLLHPLSAAQYLRAYFPSPAGLVNIEAEIRPVLPIIRSYKILDRQALFEAWQAEYGSEIFRLSIDIAGPSPQHIASLADMAIAPAMEHAVQTDDFSGIAEALIMPGRAKVVRHLLKSMQAIPNSAIPVVLQLLPTDEIREGRLDLSGFDLSTEQIQEVIAYAGQHIGWLDISFNPKVSATTVHNVIMALPRLRRLVLMGCSGLSGEDLTALFRRERHLFANMECIVHPFVFSFHSSPMNCLSVVTLATDHGAVAVSVPFATPRCIVQNLVDYLKTFMPREGVVFPTASTRPWIARAAFAAAPRRRGQSWNERSLVCIPAFSGAVFDGEGWMFLLKDDTARARKTWGFIRLRPSLEGGHRPHTDPIQPHDVRHVDDGSALTWEIHGLPSFLDIISQGQETASDEAVRELEATLERLRQERGWELMNYEDIPVDEFQALRQ